MATSNDTTQIPYGYCHCGCGQKTAIARQSETKSGQIKGEPVRYISGHHARLTYEEKVSSFWSNVAITADDDKCWLWTANRIPNGYGQKRWNNKNDYAHRVSWMITNGEIPQGLEILHSCDVRNCVNPKHLSVGTRLDNVRDMINKNRQAPILPNQRAGENNGNHKLTLTQVREMRSIFAMGGITKKELSVRYGVSDSLISTIINFKTWKDED